MVGGVCDRSTYRRNCSNNQGGKSLAKVKRTHSGTGSLNPFPAEQPYGEDPESNFECTRPHLVVKRSRKREDFYLYFSG